MIWYLLTHFWFMPLSCKLVEPLSSMREHLLHKLFITLKADIDRESLFERDILDQYPFEGKF